MQLKYLDAGLWHKRRPIAYACVGTEPKSFLQSELTVQTDDITLLFPTFFQRQRKHIVFIVQDCNEADVAKKDKRQRQTAKKYKWRQLKWAEFLEAMRLRSM